MGKGGSERVGGTVMSEDAPVNTGAVIWPEQDWAWVRSTEDAGQTAWLGGRDPGRRFDDLYNLVCDPAFLVVAWQRVAGNTGARTPGIDRATVAAIESRIGVEEFLHGVREQLRAHVHPGRGAPGDDPKASGKLRALGIPTVTDRVVQAVLNWCWNRFSRPASSRARTGSDPTGARRTRSPRSITSPPRATAGCWRPTSRRVSTGSITPR